MDANKKRAAEVAQSRPKKPKTSTDDDATQYPFTKPKTTISVAGLFAKKTQPQREDEDSTSSATRKNAHSKSAEDDEIARIKQHPAYIQVKEATQSYESHQTTNLSTRLTNAESQLLSRLSRTPDSENNNNTTSLPSPTTLSRTLQSDTALLRPLTEDLLTLATTHPNGTITHQTLKLSDSMARMRSLFKSTDARVHTLLEELEEVDAEIASTLREFNAVTHREGEELKGRLAGLEREAEVWYERALEEIARARREDRAKNVEANRRAQAFMASLF